MTEGIDIEAFKAFEASGWQERAATYDDFVSRVTGRLAERTLGAAGVEAGVRVLDVATGPGVLAGRAAVRGAQVTGVDIAPAMLEIAAARYPGVEFRQGDAEDLPFPDGAFEAAVGGFAILHLGRPERAASELSRVLVPGGRVALTVWDEPERSRLLGLILDAVAAAGAVPPPDVPAGPPLFRFADDAEFSRLLSEAGFDDARVETIEFEERIRDPDELWHGLMRGSVRTRPLVLAQSVRVQREIRSHFERLLEEHRAGDGFAVPVSVKLAAGRRA